MDQPISMLESVSEMDKTFYNLGFSLLTAPVDPVHLLKALNPLLGPNGEIKGATEAARIASLMKDACKIVSRCIYINILKLTSPSEATERFMTVGGWDTLNDWLQDLREEENFPVLVELLKVYRLLPISVDILKQNSAAKTIKQLCKSENESVKTLASTIFDEWMKKVKGNNNNNSSSGELKKKKKKDREAENDKDAENSDKTTKSKDSKPENAHNANSNSSSRRDTHHNSLDTHHSNQSHDSHHTHPHSGSRDKPSHTSNSKGPPDVPTKSSPHKDKVKDTKPDKSSKKDLKSDKSQRRDSTGDKPGRIRRTSTDSDKSDEVTSVRQGSGLKLHIKIGADKEKDGKKGDSERKRASTVKRPPSKFRSTGLLEEQVAPPAKSKPISAELAKFTIPKRPSASMVSDPKPDPAVKRTRLHVTLPSSVPPSSPSITTPTSTSPTSPDVNGKLRLTPTRLKSNRKIHESTGFMESLDSTSTSRTYSQYKKKKKMEKVATSGGNGKPKIPGTPPSPVSPTSTLARTVPSGFYKDTQDERETSPEENKVVVKKERSPSPIEAMDTMETNRVQVKMEVEENGEISIKQEPTDNTSSHTETKGLLTAGATKKKKAKKSVRWKEDTKLTETFFFELDEDERENVNRAKDFNQAKKEEMIMDRKVMETHKRLINDKMVEQIPWKRPKVIAGLKLFEHGKDSAEKTTQKVREKGVLQALFFNKKMIPDNPAEPEPEHEPVIDIKEIPLEDSSGSDEFLYNYDEHAKANMDTPSQSLLPGPSNSEQRPPGLPAFNLPPGLNLPPDVMNLLNDLQNNPPNPNDPVMSHVQQILNNLIGGSGGNERSYEQLEQIQQMMHGQLGMPPGAIMQGPPPGFPAPPPIMGPGQMMGGSGPPGPGSGPGPRSGLLGNHPPGFIPRGPPMVPPQGFPGPPGPGQGPPPGNWGPNMGPPPPNLGPPLPNMGPPPPNMGLPQNMSGPPQNMSGPPGNISGPRPPHMSGPPGNMGRPPRDMGGHPGSGPPRGSYRGGFGDRGRGSRWRGPGGDRRGNRRVPCIHYAAGHCRMGFNCGFLHGSPYDGPPVLDGPGEVDQGSSLEGPPRLQHEGHHNMSPR